MFSYRRLTHRFLPASLALAACIGLGACAAPAPRSSPRSSAAPSAAPEASPADPVTPAATPAAAAHSTASADPVAAAAPSAAPGAATTVLSNVAPLLREGAPKSYVVRRGDTLWGIANMFLKDPWLWPEIWYLNPQIHNPHRIYPGDTVRLALGLNGNESIQIVRGPTVPVTVLRPRLRSTPIESPIPAIPYGTIAAFLSRPGIMTGQQVRAAPYVLALANDNQIAGAGTQLYIKRLSGKTGMRYSVMHVDQPLLDPANGRQLGYLAIYTGTARLTQPGRIATADLVDSARETLRGDVLVPQQQRTLPLDFVPRPPSRPVSGQIIAVLDNVGLVGQYDVVAIDLGTSDGLQRGNVLSVEQSGQVVTDPCPTVDGSSTCWWHSHEKLPSRQAGMLLVFRAYRHVSYALIAESQFPVKVDDQVRSPQ